jgi:hypothetical protein
MYVNFENQNLISVQLQLGNLTKLFWFDLWKNNMQTSKSLEYCIAVKKAKILFSWLLLYAFKLEIAQGRTLMLQWFGIYLTLLNSKTTPFSFRHQMGFWYHFCQIFGQHHVTIFKLFVLILVRIVDVLLGHL